MSRRILLADDSVTIQKVIELTFMDEDFAVTAVSNGDEALAGLAEVQPDLVIADVHMPGANGYEVCRRTKAWRQAVPVLLLVGTFEPFDEAEAHAAGADAHLKKPFDSQELLSLVQELLARSATPAAAAHPDIPVEPAADPAVAGHETAPPEAAPEDVPWGSFDLEPAPATAPAEPPAAAPIVAAAEAEEAPATGRSAGFDWAEAGRFGRVDEPVFELDDTSEALGLDDSLLQDEPPADDAYPEPAPAAAPIPPLPTTPEERLGVPLGSAPLTSGLAEIEEHVHWAAERHEEPLSAPVAPSEPAAAPFAAPLQPPQPVPLGAVALAPQAPAQLSDDDVDRIARRVIELLGDKAVRDVAWEVIPDMAEVVIKDRLRELESQVE